MILWAGLFTLASVLKRKVYFPRKMMGSYEIFPHLYTIFVAKPGVARKSTTAGYAESLLLDVTEKLSEESINLAPTSVSASKLIETLSKTEDGSLTVISSEFSSFIGPTKEAMYELLTDIFDGKKKFDYATRGHGLELTEKPVVNLLAATTPAWISRQPPEHFLGGGFSSRVIFVFESKRRQYRLYYDDIDYKVIDFIGENLILNLEHIANLTGEFRHENKTLRNDMEAWYKAHAEAGTNDERMEGYYERKHVHVHKVAMLLSIAERDDFVITKGHFEMAKTLLAEIEDKMPRALASIGSNPIGHFLYDIQDFIEDREEATKKQILARFYRDLSRPEIEEIVSTLAMIGNIEFVPNGTNPTYRSKK